MFVNGPGDQGSIPGWVITKSQNMVLDATLLSTQHYKVRIKGKVEQSREWSSVIPYTLVWQLLKIEPLSHPWQIWLFYLLIYAKLSLCLYAKITKSTAWNFCPIKFYEISTHTHTHTHTHIYIYIYISVCVYVCVCVCVCVWECVRMVLSTYYWY